MPENCISRKQANRVRCSSVVLLALFTFFAHFSNAQNASLTGRVTNISDYDLDTRTTINLRPVIGPDTTFRTILPPSGNFIFKNLHKGSYVLLLDMPGYKSIVKNVVVLDESRTVEIGTIPLTRYVIELDTIIIRKAKPTFQSIGDTLAYASDNQTLSKNANVEELLQQIPGLTVDAEARIFLHGREINNLLVDGEFFFNGDTKLAIRNLPAEIVDQIQVYHESSTKSRLTGIKDIHAPQTLNIKIKPGRKMGTFGQLTGAVGTPKISGAASNYNIFRNERQLSIVAQTTNSNDLTSSTYTTGNGSPGINRIGNLGFNFKDNLTAKSKLQGAYISNFTKSDYQQSSESKTLFSEDSTLNQTANINTTTTRRMHRINVNYTLNLTNKTKFTLRPSVMVNEGNSRSSQDRTAFTESSSRALLYSNTYQGQNRFKNNDYSARAELAHSFQKKSRVALTNIDFSRNTQQGYSNDKAITSITLPSNKIENFTQQRISVLNSHRLVTDLTYIEPIAKNQIISASYIYRNIMSTDKLQLTNPENQLSDSTADKLSQIKSSLVNSEILIKYQFSSEKLSISLSSGINFQRYNITSGDKLYDRSENYLNLTPAVSLEYSPTEHDKFQTSYTFSTQPPPPSLLQNLATTADSLMIYRGNSDLRQIENHSASLSYRKTYINSPSVLSADLTGSLIRNDIQYSITLLPNGAQVTSPINVKGTRNMVGNINYSLNIGKNSLQNNLSGSLTESQSLINSETVPTRNFFVRNRLALIATLGNAFRSQISIVNSLTSMQFAFDSLRLTRFFSHELNGNLRYALGTSTLLSGNFSMVYNSRMSNVSEHQIIPVLSLSITHSILKSKAIDFKFFAHDLFNKGLIAFNSVNQNSFERVSGNIRTRFLQFSVVYNYRKFPNPSR